MRNQRNLIFLLALLLVTHAQSALRADDFLGPDPARMISEYRGCGYIEGISRDSRYLVGVKDSKGIILSMPELKPLSSVLEHGELPQYAPGKRFYSAMFSPDGKLVVTTGSDNVAIIWKVPTGEVFKRLADPDHNTLYYAAFSNDGSKVISGGESHNARVWDLASGKPLLVLKHRDAVWHAEFSKDDSKIVSISRDMQPAYLWDAKTGTKIREISVDKRDTVSRAIFSPDGKKVLTNNEGPRPWEMSANVWDVQTGARLSTTGDIGSTWILDVAFSPDGRRFATASNGVRVWDTSTGKSLVPRLRSDPTLSDTRQVQFSSDGRWILEVSGNFHAVVWDATTGEKAFQAGEGEPQSATFSPDAKTLITLDGAGNLRTWKMPRQLGSK